MNDKILLNHGAGGEMSHNLVNEIIIKEIDNEILASKTDSAILRLRQDNIAYTTDSFVIDPIFFPGGDIGKLAICGTINDLSVSGATPKYLSLSFILEEGFSISDFQKIIQSISKTAEEANVKIVTGDTKVVNKGKADKIFINTSGIGVIEMEHLPISFATDIVPGDKILLNGTIAEHGMSILAARENLNIIPEIESDCSPLNGLIKKLLKKDVKVKFMRDATRGGLATILRELTNPKFGIKVYEDKIPIKDNVTGLCETMGFDPLYIANEGKFICVIDQEDEYKALEIMQKHKYGKDAQIIGEITDKNPDLVIMETSIGGTRVVDMIAGEQLPRIC